MTTVPFFFFFSEIKYRFFYLGLSFFVTFCTSYYYSEVLFYIFALPLFEILNFSVSSFIATTLSEIFFSYLKLSLFISFYFSFFIFLINIYFFLVPGLFLYEKKRFFFHILISLSLFVLSFICTYFFIIPLIWKFFLSFEISSQYLDLQVTPKINEYIKIIIKLFLIFSFCFQIPLLIKLLLDFNIITLDFLINKRHLFIIFFFLFGGIISPPDIYSQIILAFISIFFFEITILFKLLSNNMKY